MTDKLVFLYAGMKLKWYLEILMISGQTVQSFTSGNDDQRNTCDA